MHRSTARLRQLGVESVRTRSSGSEFVQYELRVALRLIPKVQRVPNRTDLGAELDDHLGQLPLLSRDRERSPAPTRQRNPCCLASRNSRQVAIAG